MNKIKKLFLKFLATGCGTGYFPIAPATFGTILGIIIWWFFLYKTGIFLWLIIILFFITGIPLGHWAEKEWKKDPKYFVLDEIVGVWIVLTGLKTDIYLIIASFFLFRFFDIVKIQPAKISQKLPGGWGIMIDDIISAIYSKLVISVYLFLSKKF